MNTKKRYNGFLMSHKGMRAMLFDMAIGLQHADFSNFEQTGKLMDNLELLLLTFDEHAELEDEYIMPLAKKHNPDLVNTFEQEHVTDMMLTQNLGELVAMYKRNPKVPNLAAIGNKLFYAFNYFMAFNLEHMNKEETVFNEAIWPHYTDDELIGVHQQIGKSRTPEQRQVACYWMFKGCNAQELAAFLTGVKKVAPHQAYGELMTTAKDIIEPGRLASIIQLINN